MVLDAALSLEIVPLVGTAGISSSCSAISGSTSGNSGSEFSDEGFGLLAGKALKARSTALVKKGT